MKLVEVSILIEISSDNSKNKIYQPAIDINQLTVSLLFTKLDNHGSEMFLSNKNEMLDLFWHKVMEIKQQAETQNAQLL